MASVPSSARVVVIGAGIVGNSLVHHLARLGWRDIVQIDKGALPNPGGSTGHASNFIFPVDHSREITDLTTRSSAPSGPRASASWTRCAPARSCASGPWRPAP
jgi:glycine/D-amino acid oxidase-like deaminating enzyme